MNNAGVRITAALQAGLFAAILVVCGGLTAQEVPAQKATKIGVITSVAENGIRLSLGKEEGIEEGNVFGVYSVTSVVKLPLAGEVSLKREQEVGKLKVVKVWPHESDAAVVVLGAGVQLDKGMTVIQLMTAITENEAPVIMRIIPEVQEVGGGKGIPIEVKAVDREGDTFVLEWNADKGNLALAKTSLLVNKWIAPLEPCDCTLTVKAVDKWGNESSQTLKLRSKGTDGGSRTAFSTYRQFGKEVPPGGTLLFNQIKFNENGDMLVNDQRKNSVFKHFLDLAYNPVRIGPYKEEEKDRELRAPYCFDVTTDKIYVCDAADSRIRVFTAAGAYINALGAGSGSDIGQLREPADMVVAENGTIFIVDKGNVCIEAFSPNGMSRFRAGKRGEGKGELQEPVGIEMDRDGTLYILDARRKCVHLYSQQMEYMATIDCALSERSQPVDMALDRINGRLYVLDAAEEQVTGFTLDGQAAGTIGADRDSWEHISRPVSVAVNPLGQVYIASAAETRIAKYNRDGSFAGKRDPAMLERGIDVCATGNRIFVLNSNYYQVAVFDYTGWCTALYAGNSKKNGTIGKATRMAATDELLYVLDVSYNNVHMYAVRSGEEVAQIGDEGKEPGKFLGPVDIAVDRQGSLFVLDQKLKRVSIFNNEGQYLSAFESDPNASIQMNRPERMVVSEDGKAIFIYDGKLYTIIKYDRQGVAQSFYGQKGSRDIGEFSAIDALGLDEAGFLVVAESRYDRVQKIDFTGPSGRPYVQFMKETALYKGGSLYAADRYGQIIIYNSAGTVTLMR